MASTTTFSPDALHGGPVVVTLCGKLDKDFGKSCIDRGDIIFIDQQNKVISSDLLFENAGDHRFAEPSTFSMAIAAEAVTLTHNQLKHKADIYVPVVVYGRTVVNLKIRHGDDFPNKIDFYGGDTGYIDNQKFIHAHAPLAEGHQPFYFNTFRTYYKITFIQSKDTIFSYSDPEKTTPFDVFVEPYRPNVEPITEAEEEAMKEIAGEETGEEYPPEAV